MVSTIAIAMEVTIIVMMGALLCAGVAKAEKRTYQYLQLTIISLDILAMICDIFLRISTEYEESDARIAFFWAANFILSYAMVVVYHYMVLTRVSEVAEVPALLYYIVIPLALIVMGIYLTSFNTGMFVDTNEFGEFVDGEFSWVSKLIRVSLLLVDIVLTLLFCRKLGVKMTVLFLVYASVPIICQFLDERYRLCLVYLCVSIMLIIDYILVGIEQDLLIARQQKKMADQQKKLSEERTKIMISQIQPHFLYNVISSIMSFCREDPDKAFNALADFADYLRSNMRSLTLEAPVEFSKELEHVKTYLRLEKYRFDDRIEVEYDIETEDFFIPSLTVQPLIENAVKHGIGQRAEGGRIILSVRYSDEDDGIIVRVSDNGVGFDISRLKSEAFAKEDHVGLFNVRSRVESMCEGTLTIESSVGEGTTVTVFLPFEGQL